MSLTIHPAPKWMPVSLLRDLSERFPQARIVYSHAAHAWQVYEDASKTWSAQRLYNAMRARMEHGEDIKWEWWRHPGAPIIVDTLPRPPGDWLLEWLGRKDMHHIGGAKEWFRQFQEREERRKQKAKDERQQLHKDVALDGLYRHARDFARGDPLAGKRRWVHTSPADLKR